MTMPKMILLRGRVRCENVVVPFARVLLLTAGLIVFTISSSPAQSSDWMATYDQLLSKYATSSGVKYAQWKKNADDMRALDSVVQGIARENVSSMSKQEQLAFYVNAYNAWILNEALEKYPTSSVKDMFFTFFTKDRIKVAGQQMSFKYLEDKIIRAKFDDPRIHVALNCASQSCPPLQEEPFRAKSLDAQFEKLARGFVNSPRGVQYDQKSNTAYLSEIFKWYKDDFQKSGGILEFINKRRNPPLPKGVEVKYRDYNWSLNEVK